MTDTNEETTRAPATVAGERPPVKELAKETVTEFMDDDAPGLAAEIAYHAVFAVPPMLIFMIAIAAVLNNFTDIPVADNLVTLIEERAPDGVQEMLLTLVNNAVDQVSGAAAIGLLSTVAIALWSGSNGIAALMKAFNRAYDVEEDRPFVKKKLVAIGLTILVSVLVVLAFALFVFGESIGRFLADQIGLGDTFVFVWQILRMPMAIVFIMFLLAMLYYLGPNIEQSFRWISPGSVVATLIWVAILLGFNLYLVLADPGSAYGVVGSVVVLLFFFYLSGLAFVAGAEVNAVLGKRYDPATVEHLAENPDKMESREDAAKAQQRSPETQPQGRESLSAPRTAEPVVDQSQSTDPGIGTRIAGAIGTIILVFIASRFRRNRQS